MCQRRLAILCINAIEKLVAGENFGFAIARAISVLVISCPCALVLSVPLAFYSGIGAGSKKGILFKGGYAIEALNSVKAVVMDKTGTITDGTMKVGNVIQIKTDFKYDCFKKHFTNIFCCEGIISC